METIKVSEIVVENRIRKDYGDITLLASSIKEYGLIQPIVLISNNGNVALVAGGRRLEAMKSLGFDELTHGVEFVWSAELQKPTENFEYRKQSIEIEENLKRKDLSWTEQLLGKQRLLSLMQSIHGAPIYGRPTSTEKQSSQPGFGVNKLAAMLNESAASTSQDLELAALITKIPILQQQPTKEAAKRQLELAMKIALGTQKPQVATPLQYKILVECKDEEEQKTLLTQFRSVGLKCTPVVA
jgi:hypothetical protein